MALIGRALALALGALAGSQAFAEGPAPKTAPPPSGRSYVEFGFGGWQETLTATGVTGNQLSTISNVVGFCPGFGYRRPFARGFEWDFNSCVYIGGSATRSSQAARSGSRDFSAA